MATGRAGLAVSLNTTDFPAVTYFCACKGEGKKAPPVQEDALIEG